MKKIFLFLLPILLLLHITCKKDRAPGNSIDVTGTWTLYSFVDPAQHLNVTADQYPCMAGNVLTFNSDHTYAVHYIGNDTCFIALNPKTYFGIPGQSTTTSDWSQNGNYMTLGKYHAVLSDVNGKLMLTEQDTLTYNGVTDIITTIDIKK